MDQVVGDPGMIGVLHELLLEDVGRGQVGLVGLVGERLRPREVQRVEDLRLVVGRVAGGQRLEGLRAVLLARALRAVGPVFVVGGDRLDVVALARGLGPDPAPLVDGGLRALGNNLLFCFGRRIHGNAGAGYQAYCHCECACPAQTASDSPKLCLKHPTVGLKASEGPSMRQLQKQHFSLSFRSVAFLQHRWRRHLTTVGGAAEAASVTVLGFGNTSSSRSILRRISSMTRPMSASLSTTRGVMNSTSSVRLLVKF